MTTALSKFNNLGIISIIILKDKNKIYEVKY